MLHLSYDKSVSSTYKQPSLLPNKASDSLQISIPKVEYRNKLEQDSFYATDSFFVVVNNFD